MPPGTSTAAIDPTTTAGAAAISQIAGQQPAPTPASVLSSPSLPSLPQPAPTPAAPTPPAPATSPVPAASPVPSISSIYNPAPTALDTEFSTASENAANLGAQAAQQPVYEDQEDETEDITGKQATVNDLTTQLNNLKAAAAQIPLSLQNGAAGRGITAAGLQPIQTAQTNQNTIQQLGVSAMLNAANGNLSTAQDQVAAAVKAKFDPINAELAAQQAQLTALTPLLNNEEKTQAAEQAAQLQDRQNQITQQQNDMSSGMAMATAAVKNNPGNAAAQNAAQQVMQLDPSDRAYLSKVLSLVGQYQTDPTATATAVAQLQDDRADVAYKDAQTVALNATTANSSGASLAQNNLRTTSDGTHYIDGSSLTGTDETNAQQAAAAAGIPYVNAADSAVLDNIAGAQSNLAGMQTSLANLTASNPIGAALNKSGYFFEGLTQSGNQEEDLTTYNTWKAGMITAIKGISGPGTNIRNATLVQEMMDSIPAPTDTTKDAAAKIATLNQLLTTAQQSILGTLPSANTTVMTGPDGKQYNVPNGQVAAFMAAGGHQ